MSLLSAELSALRPSYSRLERDHRRWIQTEEKAKVGASVLGGKTFFQFLAALGMLPRTILKKRINSFFSFQSSKSSNLQISTHVLNQ